MQAAPPVSVRGSGGGAWSAAQATLAAAAAAAFTAWVLGWVDLATLWKLPAIAACALGAGLWAWRASRRGVATVLVWDGQRWQLDGHTGRIDVMIDLDRWLLLRFDPEARGRRRWAAIGAAEAGAAWHGLRAASHGRVAQPADAE